MTQTIIWTIAILTILGVLLAVVLYVVAEKFKVEEDPRIDEVEKVLPGANCGRKNSFNLPAESEDDLPEMLYPLVFMMRRLQGKYCRRMVMASGRRN